MPTKVLAAGPALLMGGAVVATNLGMGIAFARGASPPKWVGWLLIGGAALTAGSMVMALVSAPVVAKK
jgi:hypothetical protein